MYLLNPIYNLSRKNRKIKRVQVITFDDSMSLNEREREDMNPLWAVVSLLLVVRAKSVSCTLGKCKEFSGENIDSM